MFLISFSVRQKFRGDLAGRCQLRISHVVAVKMSSEAELSESLTEVGGFTSNMVRPLGCWQEASVSRHMGLFIDSVSVLMTQR